MWWTSETSAATYTGQFGMFQSNARMSTSDDVAGLYLSGGGLGAQGVGALGEAQTIRCAARK